MSAILAAYRHTSNNREEIEGSNICGCCCCMQIFSSENIVAWDGLEVNDLDDPESVVGGTAMCPHCGGDSVLGDKAGYPIDLEFLSRMNERGLVSADHHQATYTKEMKAAGTNRNI